jgi:hypothetical protein
MNCYDWNLNKCLHTVTLKYDITEKYVFLWQAVAVSTACIVLDVMVLSLYFPHTDSK